MAQNPGSEPETALGPAEPLTPPVPPAGPWSSPDASDRYYTPRSAELSAPLASPKPPAAPPARDPGFLDEAGDVSTQSTSGTKAHGNRPARLRDVFDNFNRKPPAERPKIPLDEPVAVRRLPSATHVVGYEQTEPIVLGRPEFE